MAQETFSVNDVIGHQLFTLQSVPVYDMTTAKFGAYDATTQTWPVIAPPSKKVNTIPSGGSTPVVYSWEKIGNDIWWTFDTSPATGTKHNPGEFDFTQLKSDGVQSTQDKLKAQQDANTPWYEKLATGIGKKVMVLATVAVAGGIAIKAYSARKKK